MRTHLLSTALRRLILSLVCGIIATAAVWLVDSVALAAMVGITVVATVFSVTGFAVLWPMDAQQTDANARRQDLSPLADEIIVVAMSLGVLAGIVGLLVLGGSRANALTAAVALVGVFMCWAGLHVMYATRYAYTFYDVDHPGGIDFNTSEDPCYRDFFYVSFAVG